MKALHTLLLSVLILAPATSISNAQVASVFAAAESMTPGAKLKFANADAVSAESGYIHPLNYAVVSTLTLTNGFYLTTSLFFRSLSPKTNSNAAAVGAFTVCEVQSVTGPAGGVLSFWEQGALVPTYMFPVGVTPAPGRNRFDVSAIELGAGLPDGDPFGAIPGRRFTANKGGEYLVTFRLYDTSRNHPTADAPIHAPSDPLTLRFLTGIGATIQRIAITNNIATLGLKQAGVTNFFVESTENIAGRDWLSVAGPFKSAPAGASLTTLRITNATVLPQQYFRLRLNVP